MAYQETKISPLICMVTLALEVTLLMYGLRGDNLGKAIVFVILALLVFVNFFSLSVSLNREALRISFGLGLVSRTVLLQDVQGMEIVPNGSLAWVYDMRREHVLRLRLRGGGSLLVGIGDAKRMMELIGGFIRH